MESFCTVCFAEVVLSRDSLGLGLLDLAKFDAIQGSEKNVDKLEGASLLIYGREDQESSSESSYKPPANLI